MSFRFRENIYLNRFIDSDDDDDYMRSIAEDTPLFEPTYTFTCDKTLGVLKISFVPLEELEIDTLQDVVSSNTNLASPIGKQLELIAVHAVVDTVYL